jgi:hypothetical protein
VFDCLLIWTWAIHSYYFITYTSVNLQIPNQVQTVIYLKIYILGNYNTSFTIPTQSSSMWDKTINQTLKNKTTHTWRHTSVRSSGTTHATGKKRGSCLLLFFASWWTNHGITLRVWFWFLQWRPRTSFTFHQQALKWFLKSCWMIWYSEVSSWWFPGA